MLRDCDVSLKLARLLGLLFFVPMFGNGLEFKYHSNKEIEAILKNFSENSGSVRTKMYSIGETYGGNKLWVLSLTASPEGKIGVPNVKLIGNMHGDEAVGREILLHFIEYLLDKYPTEKTISQLLNSTNIHVMPTLNPDGFAKSEKSCTGDEFAREVHFKYQMVDLNRNFPAQFRNNSHIIKKMPESEAVMKWMENNTFILSAALHGGALVANYPFDSLKVSLSITETQMSLTPDNDVFLFLANNYSQTHKRMHLGERCWETDTQFTGGITNGAAWYDFDGGMGDYNYAYHGCMELTLELSCCKYPSAKKLPDFWDENKQALVAFCIQANRGVSGQIIDIDTRVPITGANLTIKGRNVRFWSAKNTGEFWRILLPGKYSIKVQAKGYYTKMVKFEVKDFKNAYPIPTFLEIEMYNSSTYTTTTIPTTEIIKVDTIKFNVGKSFKAITNRNNFHDDNEVSPPAIQMSKSIGSIIHLKLHFILFLMIVSVSIGNK